MGARTTNDPDFKRLYLSDKDKKIFGVCGGLGEFFGIDPTLIRLAWIILTVATVIFPGVLAYVLAAIVMPSKVNLKKG